MLSILTNFGCHWSCPYCVYRENGINIPRTNKYSFDFNKFLKRFHLDKWYYIEQDDYNEYFVNDRIERKYLEIK